MAMPQRDDPPTPRLRRTGTIEAIKRLEPPSRVRFLLRAARYGGQDGVSCALLEYAVMHGDETERIREERTGGRVGFAEGRRPKGRPPYRREDECGIILNKEERQWQRSWRKSLSW